MKVRKRKDSTNAVRMNEEDGGIGEKDRLENENIVNSTCRVHTAEKGTLAGSNHEDCETRLHQAGCKEGATGE
jgi:hypothetical protein